MRRRKDSASYSSQKRSESGEDDSFSKHTLEERKRSRRKEAVAGSGGLIICLLLLLGVYLPCSLYVVKTTFTRKRFVASLNHSLSLFSEERAMLHVHKLAGEIGHRQEGRKGLDDAAAYLLTELSEIQLAAGSGMRIAIDKASVNGSFSVFFLDQNVTMAYSNLVNIAVRVSAVDAKPDDPAILLNAHFDSPLGSIGASDCAGCVAALLETLRAIVHKGQPPVAPLIFLFNGGEELFLLAAHGFVASQKWWPSVGAVINVESSGAAGPDALVQAGPLDWPVAIYAKHVPYPAGTAICQDVFPLVPGDTDYRMFTQDFGNAPGLDMVSILNGYVYHTHYDTPENIMPGTLQMRGENLLALIDGFSASPELKNEAQRNASGTSSTSARKNPVYFDIFGLFMVFYGHSTALLLHTTPLVIVLLAPWLSTKETSGIATVLLRYVAIGRGLVFALLGLLLALALPATLGALRVFITGTSMPWFSQPGLAAATSAPAAVAGLLIAQLLRTRSQNVNSERSQMALDWSGHWGGAVGLNALFGTVVTWAGGGSGYMTCWWAVFMIPALSIFHRSQHILGNRSPLAMAGYMLTGIPAAAYSVFFSTVFIQFVSEKMGMTGTQPLPWGVYLPDVVLPVVTGLLTCLCCAPFMVIARRWLGTPSFISALLLFSTLLAVANSRSFPYSTAAAKRLGFQRTIWTEKDAIVHTEYSLATYDANMAMFVFKHAPEMAREFNIDVQAGIPQANLKFGRHGTWLGWYPVSELIHHYVALPAPPLPDNEQFQLPMLRVVPNEKEGQLRQGPRRIDVELDLGSAEEVWTTVVNITGPLVGWSLTDGKPTAPLTTKEGTVCYVVRFCGKPNGDRWRFWLEANNTGSLQVDMSVLTQSVDAHMAKIHGLFPDWTAPIASTSFLSSWTL